MSKKKTTAEELDQKLDYVFSLYYAAELKYQRHHINKVTGLTFTTFLDDKDNLLSQLSQNNP